jgi:hypothetical protein
LVRAKPKVTAYRLFEIVKYGIEKEEQYLVACWYDRVDGKSVKELPDSISSGRYQTLEAGVLNEHTTLEVGDLLLNDGSNEFNVLGQTGSFSFD